MLQLNLNGQKIAVATDQAGASIPVTLKDKFHKLEAPLSTQAPFFFIGTIRGKRDQAVSHPPDRSSVLQAAPSKSAE
jgi:hypothetical protein